MKNSGIPWIGEIPKGWTVCFIKQIMRNKSIKGYPDEMVLSLYRDYGVVPKNSRDDNHNVTSEDTSSYKFVEVGDFVINKMKAWQGSMAVSDYQGIISPAYYICRFTTDDIDRRYIHYLLRNDTYKAEYMRLSSGMRVGQWDLNIDDFLRIKMVLPSLLEQQKISSFLDRKCAEIDEMIALQEKIVEELKAYKQSVITEAVTKGLNPDVPMRDSGIEWIGEIPEHWETSKVSRYYHIQLGKMLQPNQQNETDELCDYLCAANVGKNILKLEPLKQMWITEKEKEQYAVRKGDLLVVEGGDVASCDVVKEEVSQLYLQNALHRVRAKSNQDVRLLRYLLIVAKHTGHIDLVCNKATIPHFTKEKFEAMRCLVIPNSEQKEILSYLDGKCEEIDSLINIKLSKIDSLKEYKKSIIYEYVTGKKEVI